MARKNRPKYPNRDRVLLRRFLAQALLLLCAIGLALFYVYMNHSAPERDAAPDVAIAENPGATPQAVQDGPKPGKDAAPAKKSSASGTARDDPPAKAAASGQPPATTSKPAASAKESRQEGKASLAPHAEKSLNEVGAALAKTFGGVQPMQWGERLPGVTSQLPVKDKKPAKPVVALTLDACGGKKGASYDAELIAFLREKKIPATLFVASGWMRANPEILRALAADPLFEIAAHGSQHKPCSVNGKSAYGIKGTASLAELAREVEGNARDLARAVGKRPRWFRSGTAHYDDVAVKAIRSLDLGIAGYSVAGDEGATLPPDKVAAKTLAAKHGDILLYHMNKPGGGTCKGLKASLPALLDKGFVFVKMSDRSGAVSQ